MHMKWKYSNASSFNLTAGQYLTDHMAKMLDPEKVLQGTGYYDMIIGQDLMQALGVVIDFKTKVISWGNIHISMQDFLSG